MGDDLGWTPGPGAPITGHDPVQPYATCEMLGYREELTAAGPQLVIPGCERKPIENGKPAQLGLFG